MNRVWVVQRILDDSEMQALIGSRIHESTSLLQAPALKPFIMYRVLTHRPDLRGDDDNQANTESFLLHVHDTPGDYMRIDSVLKRLRTLFSHAKDKTARVISAEWIEDSEDFKDEDMGTILRYSRIQVLYRMETA